jgi:sortase (surface protein transpeptidase)
MRGGLVAVRWALASVVLLGGGVAVVGAEAQATSPAVPTSAAPPHPVVRLADGSSEAPGAALPVAVRIPAIGVDSPLVPLALDATGALVPPVDTGTAGWFAEGTVPGAVGPAVIAGHVDSRRGPGVFFGLRRLAPGDAVLVDRADGSTASFTVTAVDRYPKDAFPTARVYAPTSRPELRLITCGGAFDRSQRSYEEDLVVAARLTA